MAASTSRRRQHARVERTSARCACGVFLRPQYRRVGTTWIVQSTRDYARICNAVVDGVKSDQVSKPLVACGVTAPRGNNEPTATRASVSPLAFLLGMWAAGARRFDWFLLQDEALLGRWQSGLLTVDGLRKPAFAVFA